ncbi:MAG: GTPase ObgE [Planctomycetaceae bacterium]|nr:MAG: GTPase ObgE [Planctomycetaceae bacterium]
MFVDRVEIELRAGRGGSGCASFRREKFVPRGGPDGGDGGDGASIILEARQGVNSLAQFANRKFWRAPNGAAGQGSGRNGRAAKDMTLLVPIGTTLIDAKDGFVIKDLLYEGDSVVVVRGGKRGRGNLHFKSAQNQAPRERTLGGDGETRQVVLELKSIADVGLLGMPNAGKSTLLSVISAARPEIANYPFTTKRPNIGIVRPTLDTSFAMADIPGLIEGASEGIGLGHEFLRHVERAGLLVHLVEPLPSDESDPIENYQTIRGELKNYSPELATREEIIVVSKCELPGAEAVRDALVAATGLEVRMISSATRIGLKELVREIAERLDRLRPEFSRSPVHAPTDAGTAPVGEGSSDQAASGEGPVGEGTTGDASSVEDLSETAAAAAASGSASPAEKPSPVKPRRIPPHLRGLTAQLSDERQPRDFDETST